jgi:phospholipid/cholesterol/gamma-HCH transport system substrate-binding protein
MPDRNLEIKVGFFLLFSLAAIGVMIIVFGRFQESLQPSYSIQVEFPNGQGLIKGATVTLAGSPVGRISNTPQPIRDGLAVLVTLKIDARIKIKEGSRISIVDVGMLGDKAIDIQPDRSLTLEQLEQRPNLIEGSLARGTPAGGLSALFDSLGGLQESAEPIIQEADATIRHLRNISARLDNNVITEASAEDLQQSIKKLRSVLTRIDSLLADAQQGKGPLARILNDKKMADDLAAFVSNVRRKGLVFYTDLAGRETEEAQKGKRKAAEQK